MANLVKVIDVRSERVREVTPQLAEILLKKNHYSKGGSYIAESEIDQYLQEVPPAVQTSPDEEVQAEKAETSAPAQNVATPTIVSAAVELTVKPKAKRGTAKRKTKTTDKKL